MLRSWSNLGQHMATCSFALENKGNVKWKSDFQFIERKHYLTRPPREVFKRDYTCSIRPNSLPESELHYSVHSAAERAAGSDRQGPVTLILNGNNIATHPTDNFRRTELNQHIPVWVRLNIIIASNGLTSYITLCSRSHLLSTPRQTHSAYFFTQCHWFF